MFAIVAAEIATYHGATRRAKYRRGGERMADFRKSGCCDCSTSKGCSEAFSDFAAELCPSSPSKKSKDKSK